MSDERGRGHPIGGPSSGAGHDGGIGSHDATAPAAGARIAMEATLDHGAPCAIHAPGHGGDRAMDLKLRGEVA